jgi:hypothetical protein
LCAPLGGAGATPLPGDGTSLKAALDIARRYGAVKGKVLPFESGKLYSGDVKSFYALAAQLKINAYFNVGRDLPAWKAWLASKGPILARRVHPCP